MINDCASNVKVVEVFASAAKTASFTGLGIDGKDSCATGIQVLIGTVTANDASNYFDLSLKHSDDDITYVAFAESEVKSTATLVAGDRVALQYDGVKRYFRLKGAETGTASMVLSANALMLALAGPVVKLI